MYLAVLARSPHPWFRREDRHESGVDPSGVTAAAGLHAGGRIPRPRLDAAAGGGLQAGPVNQPGKQYPQVSFERPRFQFPHRIALRCQGVKVPEWGGVTLTKGEDGAGSAPGAGRGFHYYRINIDGADVPDPGSKMYFGASRWGSGIEIRRRRLLRRQERPARPGARSCTSPRAPTAHPPLLHLHPAGLRQRHGQAVPGPVPPARRGRGWGRWPVRSTRLILDNLIAEGEGQAVHRGDGQRRPQRRSQAAQQGWCPGKAGGHPAEKEGWRPDGPEGSGWPPKFDFSGFAKIMTEELVPFIDANFRTLADQPHRAMAGLSMGSMQTKQITLANLDKFSHIGMFSGGSIAANDPALTDPSAFKQKVKVLFVSYGSRETGGATAAKANQEALEKLGIKSVYYESPNTAHEWQSWRRSLYQFAPLLFQD
ncbi:MAG: alpha/beta hydrolase-fold protein [Gemmataceae bacterium]